MKLRPYQEGALANTHAAYDRGIKSAMIVVATGLGKTVIAAHLIDEYRKRGRVMVLAHREELITQAASTISQVCGVVPAIEMAGQWAGNEWYTDKGVVVSTVQTQISGMRGAGRMTRFDPTEFSLVWLDEIHHGVSKSWRKCIDHYRQNPELRLFGCTATPDRADEEALGQICEECVFEMGILDGVLDGWLVRPECEIRKVEGLDFSQIDTTAGDLNAGQLATVMEQERPMHGMVVDAIEKTLPGGTLWFAVSVAQAERTCEILQRYGQRAAWVCGKTDKDKRREIVAAYQAEQVDWLVNVGCFCEGFDAPRTRNIVLARPTKSRPLFAQMLGRGTRTLPGLIDGIENVGERLAVIAGSSKPNCNVLDFTGVAGKHKLVTAFDVLGGKSSEREIEIAAKAAGRERTDVIDALARAKKADEERKAKQEAAEAERRKFAAQREHIKAQNVIATGRKVDCFSVLDIEPPKQYAKNDGRMATPNQVAALEKFGVENPASLTFSEASTAIDQLIKNAKVGRATYKQKKLLKRYHLPTDVSKHTASRMIDLIVRHSWSVTPDVRVELLRIAASDSSGNPFDIPPPP